MIRIDTFSELLAVLYSAPLHPEQWTRFLDLLCAHTQSKSSFLICADSWCGLAIREQGGVAHDPAAIEAYAAEYSGRDPFILPLIQSGRTGVVDPMDLISWETMEESDMYRYLIAPGGYRYPGIVALTCTLRRFEVISFWRSSDEGFLDRDSVRLLEMLVPHLRSVMEIRDALATVDYRAEGAEAVVNASTTPTFLLNGDGQVLHTNLAARELLQQNDGLLLRDGLLRASVNAMQKPLFRLFQNASTNSTVFSAYSPQPLSLKRPSGLRPLQLLASPVRTLQTNSVLLLVTDPERPVVLRDDVLREHYGLTEAETEVANGLLTSYSMDEIAALRNVRIGTVREQVKSILRKTGTSKQSEMIRLLMTLPRTFSNA